MEDCAGLLTAGIALSDVAREFKRHHVCVSASESNVKLHSWLASLVHFLDTDAAERAVSTQKVPKGRMTFYIAGYPCGWARLNPWSRYGPMQGEADARCKVTYELEKVLDTFRPKFALLENTPKFKVLWDKRLHPALKNTTMPLLIPLCIQMDGSSSSAIGSMDHVPLLSMHHRMLKFVHCCQHLQPPLCRHFHLLWHKCGPT